jgi:integrase
VDVVTVADWVGNSPEVIYKHYAGMIDNVELPQMF